MSFLDSIRQAASSAWDSASEALFGSSDKDKVVAEINRLASTLVVTKAQLNEIRAQGKTPPAELSDAYLKLHQSLVPIIQRMCAENSGWRLVMPDIVTMQALDCVQTLPYEQWKAQTRKVSATGNGVGGLGAVIAVPIVIAIVAVSVGSVAYFLTAEGRARIEVAKKAADTADAIARAVAEGKLASSEARALLDKLPDTPDAGGGFFGGIGKTVVIGGIGIIGLAVVASKFSQAGGNIQLTLPKGGGTQ